VAPALMSDYLANYPDANTGKLASQRDQNRVLTLPSTPAARAMVRSRIRLANDFRGSVVVRRQQHVGIKAAVVTGVAGAADLVYQ
jgi:hypothetical protein